jgi:hypothetical protein
MDTQDPITGEWEAVLSYPDQRELMTMMLMLDGSQVSGRVESGQGVFMLENGEFVRDQLKLSLPSAQGEIELAAQLQGDRLVGEYNVADKAQGEWEAVKK